MAVNYYASSDYKYSEVIKTLQDYRYGTNVPCTIPSLMSLLNKDKIIDTTTYLNTSNIMNKNTNSIMNNINFTSCNYINIFIPTSYCETYYEGGLDLSSGRKGDEYIITFVGGNIKNCVVIGRNK